MTVSFFGEHVQHVATLAARDALTSVPTDALCAVDEDHGIYQWDGAAWQVWREPAADGTLAGLTDVDLTGVVDGDTLVYDSGSGLWVPGAPSGGGGSTGDASWTNATYAGTWGSYGSPYAAAGYRKDGQGFVHLRGLVAGGSGTIFTLPTGYRRGAKGSYNTFNNVGTGTIDVNTNGTVTLAAGGSSYASLDGITFYAEA